MYSYILLYTQHWIMIPRRVQQWKDSITVFGKNCLCLDHLSLCFTTLWNWKWGEWRFCYLFHKWAQTCFEIWVISFVSFNFFLVIFQSKYCFALYLLRFNTPEENLTEFELILFLVWDNCNVFSDNITAVLVNITQKHQKHPTQKIETSH